MRVPAVVGLVPGAVPARHRGQAVPGPDRLRAGRRRRLPRRGRPARARRRRAEHRRRSARPAGKDAAAARGGRVGGGAPATRAAHQIEEGPDKSGVFARVRRRGGERLRARPARRAGRAVARRSAPGAGLVAATRFEEQQPTWVVTGTDARRARAGGARCSTRSALRDRFAVATDGGGADPAARAPRERRDDAVRPDLPADRARRCTRARPGVAAAFYARAVRGGARSSTHPLVLAAALAGVVGARRSRAGVGRGAAARGAARRAARAAGRARSTRSSRARGSRVLVDGPDRCRCSGTST